MAAKVRFYIQFPGREDATPRFSEVIDFIRAIAAAAKELDPSVDEDCVVPAVVSRGSLDMRVEGPAALGRLPALVTRERKTWRPPERRVIDPLLAVRRKYSAQISAAPHGGQLRSIVVPPDAAVSPRATVQATSRVFGSLLRSGGESPTAQIRLPNDDLIYPKVRDVELSKRLGAHHYEDMYFTLRVTLDATTGREVGDAIIQSFEPYDHVPLVDTVKRGEFDAVQAFHDSVEALLADRGR